MNKTHLAVVGAGPGGYAAAFLAADLGLEITLIDPEINPGGVCLYRGCIPSKALLHAAKLINETQEAGKWGLNYKKPEIDLDKLRSWKTKVVDQLTGGLGQLIKQRKIRYIRGRAVYLDNHTLEITENSGGKYNLEFDYSILATGSRPADIPGINIDSPHVLNSTGALDLKEIPEKMLIIGAGYIGLEMGTVYHALGTRISVVEMMPGILPGADRDLTRVLEKRISGQFEEIMLNTKVTGLKALEDGVKVSFKLDDDTTKEQKFDKVLISIGRKPISGNIGLENTRVEIDSRGFVQVDQQGRTAEASIFAIGDIAGEPMLAHKASHEARTAVEVIAGHKAVFEPRAIPAVVFTDPEIAWAGLTETEAKEKNINVEVYRFPWAASGRALTLDRTEGLTKLIVNPENEQILGMAVVGSGAGELIAEGVLAIEMAANVTDLKLTIHPHPTLSETIMETAEMFFGTSTHVYRPKRKK
ncbi:MAG: dihydrolipoyl dehydrogenase [Calditrichaceae bacterium]|nr:dihydrolipoyl dehydrogenase [Calditrichaceae bacterium]MBN2707759.1 dihydrolipoyl dehydrogenase [Calditrichaceae bacterium]RQV96393.1 MAG: dihydrolipoyl dehydrogenase [Calditrichota bacterium]